MSSRRNYRDSNLELAIQMSDVTLQICWDSVKQRYPSADYREIRRLFLQRIENKSRRLLIERNNS
ncbi:MAG: hypothetical protein QXX17_04735 [Conexivisphaerales archaeon]